MIRRIINITLAIMLGFALTSCKNPGSESGHVLPVDTITPENSGSLLIDIRNQTNRTIISEEDLEIVYYDIKCYGPGEAIRTAQAFPPNDSKLIEGMVFGEWLVIVQAINSSETAIAGGEANVLVHAGQTAVCSIDVELFEGVGTLDLTIDWEDNSIIPYLEITAERKGYDPFELEYELDQNLNRAYVNTDLDSGYYTISVTLYDESGDMQERVGGKIEVVRIVNGQTLTAGITVETGAHGGTGSDIADIDSPEFPSPGAPEGSDAVSASTNQSDKDSEISPKMNPLAGAAYVQPPQINNYGTVSLNYPVEVAPGRAGIQPGVGLSYSSSGGDGLVGIGWSLGTGLGVISRTTRHGQLYYDHRDTFTFNGKRLIKVEDPDESETGIYRLEIESGFSRFELTDTESGGVWKVYDKAGTVTIFGEDRDSRIYRPDDEDKTYIWNFTRTYDLNGNYMYAVYDTSEYFENHILYLKEIRYTGNYNNSTPARQFVKFTYKERDEAYVSKAPGFIMRMERLLDEIIVGWDDPTGGIWGGSSTELWSYEMVYETSEDSNRQLLLKVNSSKSTTQPEFVYQEAEHQFVWHKANNPNTLGSGINPESIKYFEGDFNGDGLSDMVFFNPATGYWKAAEAYYNGESVSYMNKTYGCLFQGYDNEEKIQFFKGNVTGDYNGDGRSDIAFYITETKEFWVAEHNGYNFNFRNYGRLALSDIDIFKCEWFTGDYDGNGLSDAVLYNEPTGEWMLMANKGGSFEFIKFSVGFKNLFRDDYSPDAYMNSNFTSDDSEYGKDRDKVQFLSGDFNGDGRTDISIYDTRSGKWWVAENYRSPLNPPGGDLQFVLRWRLYKEFTDWEKGLFVPKEPVFGNDRFSGDFNGDGFSDFLIFSKDNMEWIVGLTQDGTISFRKYGRVPSTVEDITRWLQGDFNGDGRTDVGFYSKSDNNFWIGEATPDGFRYRVYNNLSYGPDPAKVLETRLPKDDIDLKESSAVVSNAESTHIVKYNYDGNHYTDKGEKVFTGYFTGGVDPEILVYRRSLVNGRYNEDDLDKGFHLGMPDGKSPYLGDLNNFNPEDEINKILNNGKPFRYSPSNDGILYFLEEGKKFNLVKIEGGEGGSDPEIEDTILAEFPGLDEFNINDSLYLIDYFENVDTKSVLALDVSEDATGDGENDPRLFLNNNENGSIVEIDVSDAACPPLTSPEDFQTEIEDIFRYYRENRANLFFLTRYINGIASVIMVDTRENNSFSGHRWYEGIITDGSSKTITFSYLDDYRFTPQGFSGSYRPLDDGSIVYTTIENGRAAFHKIDFDDGVQVTSYNELSNGVTFSNEYDHSGNPVCYQNGQTRFFNIDEGILKDYIIIEDGSQTPSGGHFAVNIKIIRDNLMNNYYPYHWIQGDYNGDGKTDIGIFHLGEPTWYFANTTGTVPDMINKVKNGIGGTYEFSYINSSTLDNTGDDNIPDLPMNYKVCDELKISDGRGNTVVTRYEYSGGYAFSGFINGYKETDYFGFGRFAVIDALGSKNISEYHNVPYTDFRKNRALAGAVKESRFIGWDGKEYSRTQYEYKLHGIQPYTMDETASFLIEPVEVRKYTMGTLTETRWSNIKLEPREYEMISKTESVTDHYSDEIHSLQTIAAYSEFENIIDTNEMRLVLKRDFLAFEEGADFTIDEPVITPNTTEEIYEYDDKGNLKEQVTTYAGTGVGVDIPKEDVVMRYYYDIYGNRTETINASGSPNRVSETSYDYAVLSQFPVQQKSYTGERWLTTQYVINYGAAFGGINQKIDPNGHSTYFDYDKWGRLIRQKADTDYGDRRILAEYFYDTNLPISTKVVQYTGTTDPAVETRAYVDGMGRTMHSVQTAGPNTAGRKYTKTGKLVYDPVGRLIRKSQTAWAQDDEIDVFRPNLSEKYPTKTEYDASGRVKKVTLPQTYTGEEPTYTVNIYNDPWEVITTHSVGRSKRTIKNARGQVLYVEDFGTGDGGVEASAKMGFAYDLAGNRTKKMDIGPLNPPEGDFIPMSLEIDQSLFEGPDVNPGVKDRSGNNIAQWRYDGFGRVTVSNDPDLGYSAVEYNEFGDVEKSIDALGRETDFSYDRLGRMTNKTMIGVPSDPDDDEGSVTYTYDVYSDSQNALGRVAMIDDPSQAKIFSYDMLGRVKKEKRVIKDADTGNPLPNGTYITSFEHDLLARKRTIYYPADPNTGVAITARYRFSSMGTTAVEIYNPAGRKNILSDIKYNEFGQMTEVRRANGTKTLYTYDIKGRLSYLITEDAAGRKLQDVEYGFRVDNSIDWIENTPTVDTYGESASLIRYDYSYDGLNRLTGAGGQYRREGVNTKGFVRNYEYAPNGNILGKSIADPVYNGEGNLIETVADTWTYNYSHDNETTNHAVTAIDSSEHGDARYAMEYDAAGNMTRQTGPLNPPEGDLTTITKVMVYDSNNRVRKVINPDNGDELMGEYWYDDQGFRVRKFAKRSDERYVEVLYPSMYFGVEMQRNPDGTPVDDPDFATAYAVNNIFLNGVRIAAVIPSGDARYYLTDQVDSVKVVVDDEGLPVSRMEYLPYGETWFQEGDENNAPKYNSQELDKETGYYFYNARHYDPEISRFVTPDSAVPDILFTQSWNRFSYVRNNPIVYKDPTGHYEIKVEVSEDRNKAGTLTLYDDYGEKIKSFTALARGSNEPENDGDHTKRDKKKADTPTGKYKIELTYEITDTKSDYYKTYGPKGFVLVGIEGEAGELYEAKKRGYEEKINIHGGEKRPTPRSETDRSDKDQYLKPTWGCIRLSNDDITDLYNEVKKIEEKRKESSGMSSTLYKVRNFFFKLTGKDTCDTVEVIEKEN